jgi:heme/copper-type cytochrome/quinol oxidase subunit 3
MVGHEASLAICARLYCDQCRSDNPSDADRDSPLEKDRVSPLSTPQASIPQAGSALPRRPLEGVISNGRLGTLLFLASEMSFFTALLGATVVLRFGFTGDWPDPASRLSRLLGAMNAAILIAGSILAWRAARPGRRKALQLGAVAVCGFAFLGIQAWEYHHLASSGFLPATDLFCSIFYALTFFHGLHVLGGAVCFAVYAIVAIRRSLDKSVIRNGAIYWHFVDVIWLVLYVILYLV